MDVDGHTPFDYCLETNNYAGIHYIFKQMEDQQMYLDQNAFSYAVKNKGMAMKRMLDATLFTESPALSNVQLPIIGYINNGKDELMFQDENRHIHLDMLKQYVDFDDSCNKIIECACSRIALNLEPGSSDSLDFLNLIRDANDDVLYSSPLEQFVQYKWNTQFRGIFLYSSIYVGYIAVHSAFVISYFDNSKWVTFILLLNCALFFFEVYQIACQGFSDYMRQLWNYVDVLGNVCLILYCSFWRKYKDDVEGDWGRSFQTSVLFIGTMAMTLRAINQLKIVSQTRTLINM